MDGSRVERAVILGEYIVETGTTIRATAAVYGVSKSTVHKDLQLRLRQQNPALYREVCRILSRNKAERHLRGGEATRRKYLQIAVEKQRPDHSTHR